MKNKVTYFITLAIFLSSTVFLQACSNDSSKTVPRQPSKHADEENKNDYNGGVGITASYNQDQVIESGNIPVNDLLRALSANDLVFIINEDGTISAALRENNDYQKEDISNESLLMEDLSKLNRIIPLLDQLINNDKSSIGDSALLVRESIKNRITLLEKLFEGINNTKHPRRTPRVN